MRTPTEYVESLRDGRQVWYRGRPVADVTVDTDLRVAIDHAALDFATDDGHRLFDIPRSAADLLARSRLVESLTSAGGTLVTLVKEIGSDALFGLMRVLDGVEYERVAAFHEHCRTGDLAVAVAQTDVKGDRSKAPHEQADPDLYVRVVDETPDGIVVRGAKCHTSVSVNANELIVLPTRAMTDASADYAVAFAVPVDSPGLRFYVSAYGAGDRDPFEFPVSSRHKMLETLTVFDDVLVPWERVFLCRRPELAAPVATAFVDYHRFTAVSYKLPLLDAFVGAAQLIAEHNGVARAGHIQDKLASLIAYAETVRGLTQLAALRGAEGARGIWCPDPLTTNVAKLTFATRFHDAIRMVQDCAGGLLVTGPSGADWASDDVRPILEKYYRGAGPAEDRLRLMHLIADLTTRDFGGYHAVLAVHAEGSIEAEKRHILRAYDGQPARRYVESLLAR
jgi:aromatic ring hydroxylase